MQRALQIHFHGMDSSEALEARIRDRVGDLERLGPEVTSCRVTVEKENRNHTKGNLFRISLHARVPGHDIVVNRSGPKDQGHADVYVALRDTFDAAERQIREVARERTAR